MISFPLQPADWQDLLPTAGFRFKLEEAQNVISRTAGGDVIRDELAASYWSIDVRFGRLMPHEVSPAEALIDIVMAQNAGVLVSPTFNRFPAADPDGSGLGGFTPSVTSVDRNARTIDLIGLPYEYELRRGDFLSVNYGVSNGRWSLHRVADLSASADITGMIRELSIEPNFPRGFSAPGQVDLINPKALAVLTPGSVNAAETRRRVADGTSFQLQTSLRDVHA